MHGGKRQMKHMADRNEDILKKMLQQTELEKAPQGFTGRVMEKIRAEEAPELAEDSGGILSPKYWIMIGLGMGIAVAFLFSYDIPFLSEIFSGLNIKNISELSGRMIQFYQTTITEVEFSVNAFIILGSAFGLFLLDRLLRKRFSFSFFSF